MYIWVVLATFLAAIASYALAPRSDYREITVEPLAEAHIGRIAKHHRFARNYIRVREPFTESTVLPVGPYTPEMIAENADSFFNDVDNYETQFFCFECTDWSRSNDPLRCRSAETAKYIITYGEPPQRWVNQKSFQNDILLPTADYIGAIRSLLGTNALYGYLVPIDSAVSDTNLSGSAYGVKLLKSTIAIPKPITEDAYFQNNCINSGRLCMIYLTAI